MDWQPIETAPLNGTVVEVRNPHMWHPVEAAYGAYTAPWGKTYAQWVLVRDLSPSVHLLPGTLVIPTEWRPAPPAAAKE